MAPRVITARIDGAGRVAAADDNDGGERVPWWSFTKTALAVATLQLVAQGRVTLDAPFDGRPYTLRQLLQHRAGLPEYGSLPAYHSAVANGETPWDAAQLLDRVGADRLVFAPGTGWRYSNVGYFLVRRKIEEIAGGDIGTALRHLVFDALGLASVRIANTAGDLAGTAWGNARGYDPRWVYHGLLVGTAGDAARFLHRLMVGEILPPDLLAEMIAGTPVGGPILGRPWETAAYGLGLMTGRMALAGAAIGHSGGGPGSVSAVYRFTDGTPRTVAAFAPSDGEGAAEWEAVRLATA